VTSPFPFWICRKLNIPASRKIFRSVRARIFSRVLALSTKYFVGMQPMFRQVPPRCSFSNSATLLPRFAAAMARE
jgi:hypothetical protein